MRTRIGSAVVEAIAQEDDVVRRGTSDFVAFTAALRARDMGVLPFGVSRRMTREYFQGLDPADRA